MTNGDPQAELLATITQGVDAAISVIDEIEAGLIDCSKRLRVDPSDETFTTFSAGITNLSDLVALMQEIRKGFEHMQNSPVSPEDIAVFAESVGMFREIQESMERKDWISVADLIQYEVSPILIRSKQEFLAIKERLASP